MLGDSWDALRFFPMLGDALRFSGMLGDSWEA